MACLRLLSSMSPLMRARNQPRPTEEALSLHAPMLAEHPACWKSPCRGTMDWSNRMGWVWNKNPQCFDGAGCGRLSDRSGFALCIHNFRSHLLLPRPLGMRVLLSWEINRYLLNGTFSDPNCLCPLEGASIKRHRRKHN